MANFPLSFKLQLEGDQEIKQKFEAIEKTLQDVKKAAEDATKPLEDMKKSIDDLSKSSSDVKKDLDDAKEGFTGVKDEADESKQSIDNFKDAVDGSQSTLDSFKTTTDDVSTSITDANTNIRESTTALNEIESAANPAGSSLDALGTAYEGVASSAVEADQNIRNANEGIEGVGTSTGQATTALDGLGSAFDGAGTSTTTFNDVLSSTGTQAQAASGGLTPLNTVLGQVGTTTTQTQSGFQGFNSNLAIMTGFIGTAASGALQFATSLSNLHGAQIKVESTQAKLSAAIETENKARAKLNELLASGTASTEEIEQATLDLQQAHEKTGIATERAGKAQDDLNIKYAKFGTETLPNLIQTVTSVIAVLGTMKTTLAGITFAEFASSIMTVGIPALAALYTAIGVLESVPALTRSIASAMEKDMNGMMTNLDDFLAVLERFASVLPGLGGAPLKLAREALDQFMKSQGIATKEVDASIPTLLDAETHQKNLSEALNILTGKTDAFGQTTQSVVQPTKEEAAAIAAVKAEIEGARAGIDGYVAGIQEQVDASSTLESTLRQTNKAMQENISQTMDLVGSSENADNAILKLNQSYADHQVKIDQLNTTLNTTAGQMASYQNAVAAGNEEFLQWVQTTRDAATQQETFRNNLAATVNDIQGFPQWMEPTIDNMKAFIRANTEGGEAAKEFARLSLESYRGLVSEAEPLFNDLKQAVQDVMEGKFIESSDVEGALINPIQAAFDKLPPLVAASLDETERAALTFSAQFANIGEQAGQAWAQNLKAHVDMGETFDQALAAANQAAIDIIAPFVEAHPETAGMIQPLIDALKTGTPQGVQEALTSLAGMQGPFQTTAQSMLDEWKGFTGQMGPAVKTGVEGAISDLTQIMAEGMQTIVDKLNTLINTGIKQDSASIPDVTVNTNPANTAIQLINTSLQQLQQYLNENPLKISVATTGGEPGQQGAGVATNPATAAITSILTAYQQLQTTLTETPLSITVDAGPAGIAIQGLQQDIDAVHGKNVTITVDTGPAGIAITQLQSDIDAVHGKNVTITVDTGAAGIAIREIQRQIDEVHGTNVFITVDTSGAQEAIRQLQNQINSLQQSMAGIGGGVAPGFQSRFAGSPRFAKGFGPAIINSPTRMLVGEAGPEMVSVIPIKGRRDYHPPSITAAAGMGQQSIIGQNYGYSGQGLWQTDAEEEAYKQQVKAAMQQGSQQGSQQGTQQGLDQSMGGMQQAVQQGAQQGVQEGMAQGYQQAPSNTEIFGAGRFTWGGGAAGTQLGGGGMGGAQYPMAPSDTSLFGTGTRFTWMGGASGTSLGRASSGGGFGGAGGGGMLGPVPGSTSMGGGFSGSGMIGGSSGGRGGGAQAFPGVYTGQVPASYGKPLGQLINGIAATILPGQGPVRQAALGMHERLKKDTMIQAHANERVDIGPGNDHPSSSSGIDKASLDKIISLLERQLAQTTMFQVDFNVDSHKLSRVASKNMGTAGYGDK